MRKSAAIVLGLLLAGGTVWGQQYLITTVAGGGLPPTAVPAVSASFFYPLAVAADGFGNVYFIIANAVFKFDGAGVLTCVAGSVRAGYSGDGGPATSARLNEPEGLAVDAAGNLFIADYGNSAIRKVAANGTITTVAGNVTYGYSGDGGPATSAQLRFPWAVTVDSAGNLYIADTLNNRIRKVAPNGTISTVAGNGTQGNWGDGGPAISAQLDNPAGVAVDAAGNLFIADINNNAIRKVTPDGVITTVAGAQSGYLAVDASGKLYVAETYGNAVVKMAANGNLITVAGNGTAGYSGDAGPATSAQLNYPQGVAVDSAGDLYIADSNNNVIRKVVANGTITTVAGTGGASARSGDGGPATGAQLYSPGDVAADAAGNLYIADVGNEVIRKVAATTGIITTVAGNGTSGYSGDGGPATAAQLYGPEGVAVDGFGSLYIADSANEVIRKVAAATGIIATVAGNGTWGYSGDGGPATSAQFFWPVSVAVDAAGNFYIADSSGGAIRKVTADGTIITLVGRGAVELNEPQGVALDASGNLYIADYMNAVIRKLAANGNITTVAGGGSAFPGDGGPATSAQLLGPAGVAVDASGNFYIADIGRIHKVAAATGIITTVAGGGSAFPGDGGPATSAALDFPWRVAVDAVGNVYVADIGNNMNMIRVLVPQTHALLSVALTQSANFVQGQMGAAYSVVVSNTPGAGPTTGTVTVTGVVPIGLTLVSMSGTGWSCSGNTCTRSDALAAGSSYPSITVTVDVAADASSQVLNQVSVSGGGSVAAGASDATNILGPPAAPVLNSPASGSVGVALAPTLVWNASSRAMSYDVYFGALSTPPLVTNTTGTSYAPPGTLSPRTTYYWQIAARNDAGTASSETWSFTTGVPAIGSQFVPVTPCRVADTRNPAGPFGGPALETGSERSFAIPQSDCGIPTTAQAYSLNVTVVPQGQLGYLTLWPTGSAQPYVSTLNSPEGNVVANAAIVAAGQDGAISVFALATAPTDVTLDINGYFDSTSGPSSSWFYPATPCRVADTRNPTGEFGGPSLFAGQTRNFPIPLSPCASAATVTAYSLNVTAVPDTDYLGYLTTWPTGSSQPLVSTLNSWTGKVVANAALVPAGSNGSISVFVTDPTDVILDINGFFGQPGRVMGLSFYPVTPCRVADTRNPIGPFGGPEMEAGETRSFAIPASACNIPTAAAAYALNVTVVPSGVLSYLTTWPTGLAQPLVSTLNSFDGSVVANAAIMPGGTGGAISVYVTNQTHVILDVNGYFAP